MKPIFMINGIFPAYYGGEAGFTVDQITENLAYVIDNAGWKLFKRNGVSTALISVETVSGVNAVTPFISFTAKKIPYSLIEKVVAFFKEVYHKYQSEAVGYLYYQTVSGEWDFVVPRQSASAAHASYEGAPKKAGWQCAGTIHSHAALSAFHSGTDDADEANFDGIHITVGRVAELNPEFSCSLVIQGERVKFEIHDLVDGFPIPVAPPEWIGAVKLPAPHITGLPFKTQAEELYDHYYNGQISEADYLAELKKIEKNAEKAAEAERQREKENIVGFGTGKKNKKNYDNNNFNFSSFREGGGE